MIEIVCDIQDHGRMNMIDSLFGTADTTTLTSLALQMVKSHSKLKS